MCGKETGARSSRCKARRPSCALGQARRNRVGSSSGVVGRVGLPEGERDDAHRGGPLRYQSPLLYAYHPIPSREYRMLVRFIPRCIQPRGCRVIRPRI